MEPLASKIRPASLSAFAGQEHLVGTGKPLREAMEGKHLFSFILWGPPGSGKTTLARLYAAAIDAEFHELSAVDAGKDDIKRLLEGKRKKKKIGTPESSALFPLSFSSEKPLVLFIDEIHRFNKAQQDFLLPFVERGDLTIIGATTENPSFEIIPALLSRCRVFVLSALSDADMEKIISRAAKILSVKLPKDARDWLVAVAGGDARQALGVLENTKTFYGTISPDTLQETLQSRQLRYDKKGDEHYDTISAFIKSMRAGQPNSALYYLARMVESGEDPLFIARRMVVFASEDIGLAQPTALVVANAVFDACEKIGYPEAQINLAHGAAYLAACKKSRESYDAYFAALADVQQFGNLPIPMNIRNAPTKLMKELGYHKNYKMYDTVSYLPEKLKGRKYFKKEADKKKKE